MSIWDEIVDIFTPKDELDKKKENEYKLAKQKEKDLLNQLYDLDKEYISSLPKKEEKDYASLFKPFSKKEKKDNLMSDEELDKIALEKAYDDYDKKLYNINDSYKKNKDKATENLDKVIDTGKDILLKLNKQFAINENNINNKMTSKGLGLSSIKDNLLKENTNNIASKKQESRDVTNKYLNNINNTVKGITDSRDKKINDLKYQTNEDYNRLLTELYDKRNTEKQKINDYNDKIKQEKIDYDNKVLSQIESLKEKDRKKEIEQQRLQTEYENKYGYTGDKKINYDKRLNLATEFYDTLPKELALRVAKNNLELKKYLGAYYYPLINHLQSRYERQKIFS